MKLGFFTMPLHPAKRDYAETLKEDREAIVLADALGYAEAFIGEHVSDRAETITSCLMFIASLAHETKRITLGSGTVNLPNNHPARGAEMFKHDLALADSSVTLDYVLDSLVISGTVPSVVDQILAFRESVGDFGTLLYAGHDWADKALARRSMELMANDVMPAVNEAIRRSNAAH